MIVYITGVREDGVLVQVSLDVKDVDVVPIDMSKLPDGESVFSARNIVDKDTDRLRVAMPDKGKK